MRRDHWLRPVFGAIVIVLVAAAAHHCSPAVAIVAALGVAWA